MVGINGFHRFILAFHFQTSVSSICPLASEQMSKMEVSNHQPGCCVCPFLAAPLFWENSKTYRPHQRTLKPLRPCLASVRLFKTERFRGLFAPRVLRVVGFPRKSTTRERIPLKRLANALSGCKSRGKLRRAGQGTRTQR